MTEVAGARAPEPPRGRTSPPSETRVDTRRIEIIVNPLSGGVGPRAARECEQLLATMNISANLAEIDPNHMEASVSAALASKPGRAGGARRRRHRALRDIACGSRRSAGEAGTRRHHEPASRTPLYGAVDWKRALKTALTERRRPGPVPGGEVDGRPFQVAAILGSPAL